MPKAVTIVESIMKTMQAFFPLVGNHLLSQTVYRLITAYHGMWHNTDEIFEFSVVWLSQFSDIEAVQRALDDKNLDIWQNSTVFGEVSADWDAIVQNTIDESNYDNEDVTFACLRCNSTQVTVTTAQVRSADEGMTEFRNCRNCGFVGRINS